MDIDELQSVQSRERQTDSLQQLRDSFYADASGYIQQLREARDRAAERADDPYGDPEVRRLSDEIDTAEQTVEAIYDRRTGKIVKKASLAAADMPADEDGLTAEERELFESLVEDIVDNREHVLDLVAGSTAPDDDPATSRADHEPSTPSGEAAGPGPDDGVSAADLMSGEDDPATDRTGDTAERAPDRPGNAPGSASAADPPESGDASPGAGSDSESVGTGDEPERVDRTTVQITRDVGEILGVDQRAYDLSTDDVVTLPEANAGALLEQGAAEKLE